MSRWEQYARVENVPDVLPLLGLLLPVLASSVSSGVSASHSWGRWGSARVYALWSESAAGMADAARKRLTG